MENKTEFFNRENRHCQFDKRLILEAVKLIEEGVPRKEVNRIYNLGASTLDTWLRDYGSKNYHASKKKNFSPLEKRKILADVEQGRLTLSEAQKKYNIKSPRTIHKWLNTQKQENIDFCYLNEPHMAKNKQDIFSSKRNNQNLEKALEEAQLKIEALNTMIDVAEGELKIDIRKKSGTKQ